jgi:hypothetical protein
MSAMDALIAVGARAAIDELIRQQEESSYPDDIKRLSFGRDENDRPSMLTEVTIDGVVNLEMIVSAIVLALHAWDMERRNGRPRGDAVDDRADRAHGVNRHPITG